jgi:hypothetical protein
MPEFGQPVRSFPQSSRDCLVSTTPADRRHRRETGAEMTWLIRQLAPQ